MQPNAPQYSIDYLNQIAPEEKKPGISNRLFFAILGAALLIAAIVFIAMLSGGIGSPTNTTSRLEHLSARLATLQTISGQAQKDITSNQLEATNGNLNIALTNASRAIQDPLTKNNIDPTKIPQSITAAEDGSGLTATLADAKLNAIYDRVYAREMNYQIATVLALMNEINTNTKSQSVRDFITQTTNDLKPLNDQLANFQSLDS